MLGVMLFCVLFLASFALGALVLRWLRRFQLLDVPNARSSHSLPTPRGAGWVIVLLYVPLFIMIAFVLGEPQAAFWHGFALLLLIVVSVWDDVRGAPWRLRLGVHVIAAGVGLIAFGDVSFSHHLLPFWFERACLLAAWVWLINLTNFIDGIDGITLLNVSVVALGTFLGFWMSFKLFLSDPDVLFQALTLTAVSLGLLPWNFQRARMFLGDVGSIVLGYFVGLFFLSLLKTSLWPLALLVYSVPVFDASFTLLKRLFRRSVLSEAHREHLYQRLVDVGLSHRTVSLGSAFVSMILALWGVFLSFETAISPVMQWSGVLIGWAGLGLLYAGLEFFVRQKATRSSSQIK